MKEGAIQVQLSWEGPFKLTGSREDNLLLCPSALQAGIYIWSVLIDGQDVAYYVGETGKTFAERHLEHFRSYFDGEYKVYDPVPYRNGQKTYLWDGALGPRNKHKLPAFRERFDELGPKVQEILEELRFYLIPVAGGVRVRQRIEAYISRAIRENSPSELNFQDSEVRYRPCKKGEPPLHVVLDRSLPIVGIDGVGEWTLNNSS